jgi:hypothetical protein
MSFGSSTRDGAVEYAVAWSDAGHQRHLGRARVEDHALVLEGTPPGGVRRTIRIPTVDMTAVGLNRWRPSPAVAVESPQGEIVVELLLGGWGAAHQLENAIAAARAEAPEQPCGEAAATPEQVTVVAEIRPGKRADLERALAEGSPFDLPFEGFEHHEVFVGDREAVFVFTGPGAAAELRRLAATPELFRHAIHMADVLAAPRLLERRFQWGHAAGRHVRAS